MTRPTITTQGRDQWTAGTLTGSPMRREATRGPILPMPTTRRGILARFFAAGRGTRA